MQEMNNIFLRKLLLACGLVFLLPVTANANIILNGVWDNYTLGTTGDWYLNYQRNDQQTAFSIDFNGDFLGNGVEPDVLNLIGATKQKGSTQLHAVGHNVFGDVRAKINQRGKLKFLAENVPGGLIESVALKGMLTETDFNFLHHITFEDNSFSSGVTLINYSVTIDTMSPYMPTTTSGLYIETDYRETPYATLTAVPLPSTFLLFFSGLGLLFTKKRVM